MSLFEYVPEPLLLLVIGIASLLFGLVLHATREPDPTSSPENAADLPVEISHALGTRTGIE